MQKLGVRPETSRKVSSLAALYLYDCTSCCSRSPKRSAFTAIRADKEILWFSCSHKNVFFETELIQICHVLGTHFYASFASSAFCSLTILTVLSDVSAGLVGLSALHRHRRPRDRSICSTKSSAVYFAAIKTTL